MAKLTTRKYAVKIKGSSGEDIVHAAYWNTGGATPTGTRLEEGFVAFKSTEHANVYAVRVDMVDTIREITDQPVVDLTWDDLRVIQVALSNEGARGSKAKTKGQAEYHEKAASLAKKFIDADRTVGIAPSDPVADIIHRVQDGYISIDEARVELGMLPWGLSETNERREWS